LTGSSEAWLASAIAKALNNHSVVRNNRIHFIGYGNLSFEKLYYSTPGWNRLSLRGGPAVISTAPHSL
jgi:hypothetical protein